LRFFGGFYVFPGGRVDREDAEVLPSHPRHAAVVRELFEEAGVLLARRADGSFPGQSKELDDARRDILAERFTFGAFLRDRGLTMRIDDLQPVGNLVTPEFSRYRFDTTFFTATLPAGQEPTIITGELAEGRWATAQALLDEWTRGEALITPPTLFLLEGMRGRAMQEVAAQLAPAFAGIAAGGFHPIFWAPQVQHIPLLTVALPPSRHTNAYLVGRDPAYLIDPGAEDPAEQQRLFAYLDEQRKHGTRLAGILLTHHHPDHLGAAGPCAQRYGVPIWAHPETIRALTGKLSIEKTLMEGSIIDLGRAPDGPGNWHLETFHTPGHAAGHLDFWEPRYRLLFVGDMISTISSVVIGPPPHGDLAQYLHSLRQLREIDCRLLLPAHGVPTAQPRQVIDEAILHREKREEQLVALLEAKPWQLDDLVHEVYRELPPELLEFARYQTLAGLHKLQSEGRVQALGEEEDRVWRIRRP
jgi:glyoxylase-like metal-dependent hydrolase (beta-lactamase superfamily II)/8-oxo-dGTP pyrophosphatase MutT (NUDIX family)